MNLDESGLKIRPFDAARHLDTREAQAKFRTASPEHLSAAPGRQAPVVEGRPGAFSIN